MIEALLVLLISTLDWWDSVVPAPPSSSPEWTIAVPGFVPIGAVNLFFAQLLLVGAAMLMVRLVRWVYGLVPVLQ